MQVTALHEQVLSLAGVPALVLSLQPPEVAARRGTVLVLHGLTASKEIQRTEALSLARHGYLAVALDAVGHGARRYPDFEERFAEARMEPSFYEVVEQSAAELPAVLDALRARGWALPGRVGACGISMGGFILFGAVVARVALDAVVPLVASPHWVLSTRSPHLQLDRFFPTPLLIQNASDDQTVLPAAARALHQALLPRYAAAPERLRYVEHENEPHLLTERAWHLAWADTLGWFDRFLQG